MHIQRSSLNNKNFTTCLAVYVNRLVIKQRVFILARANSGRRVGHSSRQMTVVRKLASRLRCLENLLLTRREKYFLFIQPSVGPSDCPFLRCLTPSCFKQVSVSSSLQKFPCVQCDKLNLRRYIDMPASHYCGPGSVLGKFMRDFWWTKWTGAGFLRVLLFERPIVIPQNARVL
jgi:hypothetical protein